MESEIESDRTTTDTPQLALTGELWSVYFEDVGENWLRDNDTAQYMTFTFNQFFTLRKLALCG